MMGRPGRLIAGLILLGVLAPVPWVANGYQRDLVQEILIFGIFAMSLDLLMGYAGMVSFGHSAFFGLGGYAAALAMMNYSPSVVTGLLVPAAVAALAALVIGFFSIRVGGVYFIMLTLAFSQMFFAYAFQVAWLGSSDGISGVPRPAFFGVDLTKIAPFHFYLLGFFVLSAFLLWRVVRSPVGQVLRGIHENEGRMIAVGYPVQRFKLIAFVAAGIIAGIAGSLFAQLNGYISPRAFFWTTSGEVLLMCIIGGTGTLVGPVLGAAVFILLQSLVSTYTERWMLILGIIFIVFVLFAPGGIMGLVRGRARR